MRILRALGGRLLPCGCLVGRYETYSGRPVWILDAVAPSCDLPAHRPNAVLMRITQESANVLRPSFPQKP
jgi:hypothetical protein